MKLNLKGMILPTVITLGGLALDLLNKKQHEAETKALKEEIIKELTSKKD